MTDRIDTTEAYLQTRERIAALVTVALAANPELADQRVPACPDWSLTALLSHLAGVAADLVAQRLDGVGSDAWTEEQVRARAGQSPVSLLEEWAEQGALMAALLGPGALPGQLLFDTVSHEHDVRGLLGEPGGRGEPALGVSLRWELANCSAAAAAADNEPFAVDYGGTRRVIGAGDPVAVLRADAFELFRAFSGRRSLVQLRALDWSEDPEPFLRSFTFGPFAPREEPLDE